MKVTGEIIKGDGKATELGFPTFNIALPDSVEEGVYAGSALYGGQTYRAIIFANARRGTLEAHLLAFDKDVQEGTIEVVVGDKVRDRGTFASDAELAKQIQEDINIINT